jgi:hypothetical protein
MPECVVDGIPTPVDSTLKTWGEVLDVVDQRLSSLGRAVTAVRFDGVDQPSFREADVALQPPPDGCRLEIDSVELSTLLRETMVVAESGLAVLVGGSRRVATAFRGPDIVDANQQLAELLEAVRNLTTLTGAISQVGRFDLATLSAGSSTAERAIEAVASALGTLVARQQAEDWQAVATGLEDEMAPALAGWRDLLDAIGSRCCA